MKTPMVAILLIAVVVILGAIFLWKQQPAVQENTITQATLAPQEAKEVDTADWKVYTNSNPKFSFRYPPTWTEKPMTPSGNPTNTLVHHEGPEGFIQVETGTGFGGACPLDQQEPGVVRKQTPVFSIDGETISACDILNSDDSESFEQIYFDLADKKTGSIRAKASAPRNVNSPVILKILSTFKTN